MSNTRLRYDESLDHWGRRMERRIPFPRGLQGGNSAEAAQPEALSHRRPMWVPLPAVVLDPIPRGEGVLGWGRAAALIPR